MIYKSLNHHVLPKCKESPGAPARGDLVRQIQPNQPLNPSPLLSTPSPNPCYTTTHSGGNKQMSVRHRGPLTVGFGKFIFYVFPLFLTSRCLIAGCLGRQVISACKGGRRGCPGTQGVQESRVGAKDINLWVLLMPSRLGVPPCFGFNVPGVPVFTRERGYKVNSKSVCLHVNQQRASCVSSVCKAHN